MKCACVWMRSFGAHLFSGTPCYVRCVEICAPCGTATQVSRAGVEARFSPFMSTQMCNEQPFVGTQMCPRNPRFAHKCAATPVAHKCAIACCSWWWVWREAVRSLVPETCGCVCVLCLWRSSSATVHNTYPATGRIGPTGPERV